MQNTRQWIEWRSRLFTQFRRRWSSGPSSRPLLTRRRCPDVEQLEALTLLSAGHVAAVSQTVVADQVHVSETPESRVQSIQIAPPFETLLQQPGARITFTAIPRDADGNLVEGVRVHFKVLNPADKGHPVARIEPGPGNTAVLEILSPSGAFVSKNSSVRVEAMVGEVHSKPVLVTREASGNGSGTATTWDDSYYGSYSGTVTGDGVTEQVQGAVEFSVLNGNITVTVPGSGSGNVASDGLGDFGSGGGALPNATFTADFLLEPNGQKVARGSWTSNSDGVTGSGTWSATSQ